MTLSSWAVIVFAPRGRITRSQFWVIFVATLLIGIANNLAIEFLEDKPEATLGRAFWPAVATSLVVGLGTFYVSTIVAIKRLHDHDRSGAWYLVGLIPILGWLWLLVQCGFRRGMVGANRFGPDPRTLSARPPA